MKGYRILLVILLMVVIGCGAWYFYGVFHSSGTPEKGTLVKEGGQICSGSMGLEG